MAFFSLPQDSWSQPLPATVPRGTAHWGTQPHAGQRDKAQGGAVSHGGLGPDRAATPSRCRAHGAPAPRDAPAPTQPAERDSAPGTLSGM